MRLLVFEDEGCADLAPTALCVEYGHEVVGVSRTIHEAIHLARSARPDIALVLTLEEGSDNAFLLMHSLSKSGVPCLLLPCEAVQGARKSASLRWNEAELAAALARYQRKLSEDDDSDE